ncbi:MAG: methylthioribulose 1-phosphate dehydratase [Alphaproteobacteria bacterium]|nr:methylthioribulose 1-phosphate dehydratase [Alphaproteobacteria bacterium]MCB9794570.1 methylthioribulose 1-phosphate dehydratase [Alphaproteobacteria bacterium]
MVDSPEVRALVEAVRYFHGRGWCPATSSNFSLRDREGLLISRSGVDKGALGPEQLMRLDAAGAPRGPGRPSAETPLHLMLYARDPGTGAVLHTHSPHATVLSRMAREAGAAGLRLEGWEILKGLAGVGTHELALKLPVFDNDQDMPALAARVREALGQGPPIPGFLLAGHGLYAWGRDLAEARRHVEVFEFLFECITLQGRLNGHA